MGAGERGGKGCFKTLNFGGEIICLQAEGNGQVEREYCLELNS